MFSYSHIECVLVTIGIDFKGNFQNSDGHY